MKTKLTSYRRARLLAIGLAWSASLAALTNGPLTLAVESEKKSPGFVEKMKKWQDEMSRKFRDTWKSHREASKEKSMATASVDLREDKDNYTIRLNLPDRDLEKVEITLEKSTLRILAPTGDKGGRYEQTIGLAEADPAATPKIERRQKDSMIVITVPKVFATARGDSSLTLPDPSLLPLADWDRDIVERMAKMRREMDRIFDESFREFRTGLEHKGFFDEPRFGSSLDLKEEGDNYVVRVHLPDRDMQNINVTVKDRTLTIEAKEESTKKKEGEPGTSHSSRIAAYSQLLTLPGPVEVDKMKVEKKEGMLIVTLPKVKSSLK